MISIILLWTNWIIQMILQQQQILMDLVKGLCFTGNQSYGYFIGGYGDPASPGEKTIVSRLDYSNDSAATFRK